MLKGKTNGVCRIAGRLSLNAKGRDKLLSLILMIKLMILILLIRY
jgi:hypothetical protein